MKWSEPSLSLSFLSSLSLSLPPTFSSISVLSVLATLFSSSSACQKVFFHPFIIWKEVQKSFPPSFEGEFSSFFLSCSLSLPLIFSLSFIFFLIFSLLTWLVPWDRNFAWYFGKIPLERERKVFFLTLSLSPSLFLYQKNLRIQSCRWFTNWIDLHPVFIFIFSISFLFLFSLSFLLFFFPFLFSPFLSLS